MEIAEKSAPSDLRCACGALVARVADGRISIKYKDLYFSFTKAENISTNCRMCGRIFTREILRAA